MRRFFDGIDRLVADARQLERRGFRPAGAALPRAASRVQAPRYWENGRRRPGVPLEQLPQPLSLAARRPHGRAVGVPGPRPRRASTRWRSCSAFPANSACRARACGTRILEGRIDDIRNYCETDVVNTYLIYLRFELMRGRLTHEEHDREVELVRGWLGGADEPHLREYVDAWAGADPAAAMKRLSDGTGAGRHRRSRARRPRASRASTARPCSWPTRCRASASMLRRDAPPSQLRLTP